MYTIYTAFALAMVEQTTAKLRASESIIYIMSQTHRERVAFVVEVDGGDEARGEPPGEIALVQIGVGAHKRLLARVQTFGVARSVQVEQRDLVNERCRAHFPPFVRCREVAVIVSRQSVYVLARRIDARTRVPQFLQKKPELSKYSRQPLRCRVRLRVLPTAVSNQNQRLYRELAISRCARTSKSAGK